ncbi:PREDICTED: nucleolar GTP-binding protein 2-like [Camelina sativa]|uniref:Nucleolar GTP-binding protein 2-like n=1 Tax=Camelina sativa TaxID=90675 RepID=A0ABM0SVL8_CAMSA|nr:PREDICTED: nucleolar GTP-binding protein 2-like [Camelina sativa]
MIKGSNGNRGSSSSGYSADLLVCFPSRAHLALTPKPICSPSRPSDSSTNRRPHHRRQLSKLSGGGGGGGGHGSPALWAKQASSKNMGGDEIAEPTSPKVTCAGQIKVRPSKCGGGKGKNWQSVMEEIERIHDSRSQSKFLGLKKDVMGFLTCLRNIRFDFRCFGDFRHADVTSDDEEDEDDDEDEDEEVEGEEENSKNVFSKWFMVLQEEQSNNDDAKNNKCCDAVDGDEKKRDLEKSDAEPAVPPPNALFLMRCRSAPAKSWLEERMKAKTEQDNREEEEETEDQETNTKKTKKDLRSLMEEEKMELVLMRYDTEFYRLSSDIAKETWVVGGVQDPLSRSRSWKS